MTPHAPPLVDGPLVLVAGLYGSGSTWAYNAVRALLGDDSAVRAGYSDDVNDLPGGDRGLPAVVKCHLPDAALRRLARIHPATVVITVRDPRDALVSTIRRFALPPLDVRRALVVSAERLLALADTVPALILRYEDGFPSDAGTLPRLARALLVSPPAERLAAITESLSAPRVRARIEAMAAEGVFGPTPAPRAVDPLTQWHPTHLGDGRVGKHAEVLTPDESASLLAETAPFCARFGYA